MKKLSFIVVLIGLTTLSLKSNATPIISRSKTSPIDSVKKVTVDPV